MGMEIYCEKRVRSDKEHTYWLLRLPRAGWAEDCYSLPWIESKHEISYFYDAKERRLTWGGWSLKCRKDFGGYQGLENTPLNKMKGKSVSKKKLASILPLWNNGDKKEVQHEWLRHWDDTAKWYIG